MSKGDAAAKLIRIRLLGESLRECGVLVLIFAPLDILLEVKGGIDWPQLCWKSICLSRRHVTLLFFAAIGIFLLYYGIRIEGDAELALREIEETKGDPDAIPDASV